MPVEFIGWTSPQVSSEIIPAAGPVFSSEVLANTARVHEVAGFDRVLIGYFTHGADGFMVGAHTAAVTERLGLLLAHRPGFIAPTLAARKLATLDQLSGGRLALHVIAGGGDADQACDGDFADHDARYRRGDEYVHLMRRMWTEAQPFDHEGEFYRVLDDPLSAGTAHSALRRRRFRRRDQLAGAASRHLHVVGRAARRYACIHGPCARRGGPMGSHADVQRVHAPDSREHRRRSMGSRAGHLGAHPQESMGTSGFAAASRERRLATPTRSREPARRARHLPVHSAGDRDRRTR
jgi:alkanesulfonate monooxygenase SsuD/methylene tetrahydromethanopterin reductase-like flavin-dependent oxidoreductase (luciferase family)